MNNDHDMSSRVRDLFEAAKVDGPSDAARDAMWAGIQTTAIAGTSASSPPGAPASTPSASNVGAHLAAKAMASSKLALGIALGASITIGVAGAVLMLARPWAPSVAQIAQPRPLESQTAGEQPSADRTGVLRLPPTPVIAASHADAPTVELDHVEKSAPRVLSERDRLAQEARMVSEARGALHRGEPETALRIVRTARRARGARLVPEELTVEAQALRAMGDEAGAARAEAELAGKFPEQDLGQ